MRPSRDHRMLSCDRSPTKITALNNTQGYALQLEYNEGLSLAHRLWFIWKDFLSTLLGFNDKRIKQCLDKSGKKIYNFLKQTKGKNIIKQGES